MLSGCNKEAPLASQAISAFGNSTQPLTHDFGSISVDNGPVRLEHAFRIGNGTQRTIEIQEIKKSCGCLEAHPTRKRIQPGESVEVTLALELRKAGPTAQAATIICADGQVIPMRLQATGTREFDFAPILLERTPHDGALTLRFSLVTRGSQAETQTIELVSPAGMAFEFDGWRAIELAETAPGRPTRQLGTGRIDVSRYSGSLPTTVTFRVSDAVEATIEIGAPLPPTCE